MTGVAPAVAAWGWSGVVLPETQVFGCRVHPVVVVDVEVHRDRVAAGQGPQLDGDTLAMWEWPEFTGAPQPALHLTGMVIAVRRSWAGAVQEAMSLRGFGGAAVLDPNRSGGPRGGPGRAVVWEADVHGVGLAVTTSTPDADTVPAVEVLTPAESGRRPLARRRTADRWLEEVLYRHALDHDLDELHRSVW